MIGMEQMIEQSELVKQIRDIFSKCKYVDYVWDGEVDSPVNEFDEEFAIIRLVELFQSLLTNATKQSMNEGQ